MAYTNETTHYGIPLPLGSDLTTPMDYNESMQDVDTALFESKTDSSSALQKANQLQQDLATTNGNVTSVTGRVTTLEGTVTTQGQSILQNTQDISDVRADALDMIVAKDEGTAQVATVAVAEGEYFRYNDVLYIATQNIAIGDTIVPNTNCKATNVGAELNQLNNDLSNLSEVKTSSGTQAVTLPFVAPKDGYFVISADSGQASRLVLKSPEGEIMGYIYCSYESNPVNTIYLKKGVQVQYYQGSSPMNVYFAQFN